MKGYFSCGRGILTLRGGFTVSQFELCVFHQKRRWESVLNKEMLIVREFCCGGGVYQKRTLLRTTKTTNDMRIRYNLYYCIFLNSSYYICITRIPTSGGKCLQINGARYMYVVIILRLFTLSNNNTYSAIQNGYVRYMTYCIVFQL